MRQPVEDFERTLNKAAELVSKEAVPVFVDAITSMSIQDGSTLLRGGENAATNFLRQDQCHVARQIHPSGGEGHEPGRAHELLATHAQRTTQLPSSPAAKPCNPTSTPASPTAPWTSCSSCWLRRKRRSAKIPLHERQHSYKRSWQNSSSFVGPTATPKASVATRKLVN
jgi:hypothetical protein